MSVEVSKPGFEASADFFMDDASQHPRRIRLNGSDRYVAYDPHMDVLLQPDADSIRREHSALIGERLEGHWDVYKLLRTEGRNPEPRAFTFVDINGNLFHDMDLIHLGVRHEGTGRKEHTAVFAFPDEQDGIPTRDFTVIKVADILRLHETPPENGEEIADSKEFLKIVGRITQQLVRVGGEL